MSNAIRATGPVKRYGNVTALDGVQRAKPSSDTAAR